MPKDLLVALPVPGTVRGMTTGMLGHPCPGSVAGLQMGSNVSDEAWAVQDDLVMPINMGSSDLSGLSRPARDIENGDIQPVWALARDDIAAVMSQRG